jgi:hypothetical protein
VLSLSPIIVDYQADPPDEGAGGILLYRPEPESPLLPVAYESAELLGTSFLVIVFGMYLITSESAHMRA